MKRYKRIIIIISGIILLIVVVLGGAWFFITRRTFPRTRGTITLQGLNKEVEIRRDSDGIPHIYAKIIHDLYFAQGFVHAQDRFWQMEFWRRIGAGRLSELFGKSVLGTDIYLRTVGFKRVAEKEYELYDDESKQILEAYSAGVNSYIQSRPPARLGLEFLLLKLQGVNVEIEPPCST